MRSERQEAYIQVEPDQLTRGRAAVAQMRAEFDWLPADFFEAMDSIASGLVVVPDMDLDRSIHAVCLISKVYNRLNAIMSQHLGFGFEHRPKCSAEDCTTIWVSASPLTPEEQRSCQAIFTPLFENLKLMDEPDAFVRTRQMEPGVYTKEFYHERKGSTPVVLH